MSLEKKITAGFVFIGCIGLMYVTIYLFLLDLDFFTNGKVDSGTFNVIRVPNNKLRVTMHYYDEYRKENTQTKKEFSLNYLDNLNRLDSNYADIIYTKWFKQAYLKNIKTPRVLILLFEAIMILIAVSGALLSIREIRKRSSVSGSVPD